MSRSWRGLLGRGLVVVLLSALLAGGALLAFRPTLLTDTIAVLTPLFEQVTEIPTQNLLTAGAVLVAVVAALVFARRKIGGGTPDDLVLVGASERSPETTSVDPLTVAGVEYDDTLRRVRSISGTRNARRELRETALAAIQASGTDEETARSRLEAGEWTDDPLAEAFLSDSQPVPLLARVRGWLDTEAEARRRLTRTIDALHEFTQEGES